MRQNARIIFNFSSGTQKTACSRRAAGRLCRLLEVPAFAEHEVGEKIEDRAEDKICEQGQEHGTVEKLGDGVLLSLNKKYKPIPMKEDMRVNGKVIGILDPEWF